jgi:hypothetical protein
MIVGFALQRAKSSMIRNANSRRCHAHGSGLQYIVLVALLRLRMRTDAWGGIQLTT